MLKQSNINQPNEIIDVFFTHWVIISYILYVSKIKKLKIYCDLD